MEEYDYVVVGAGSGGCVAAARLSEDPDQRILLIEAGPPATSFWINTPGGVAKLFDDRRVNWAFTTDPVDSLGGRTVNWPRGKTFGGSSAINGMVYMRGHPRDFDLWSEMGNEGWGWNEVLPYFRKSEANARGADDHQGGDGPLSVTDPVERHPSATRFLNAAKAIGIPEIRSLNAPPYEGVAFQQFTIRKGKRETSYTAFIEPIRHRQNLKVVSGLLVLRVMIEDGQATGVEVLDKGRKRVIHASREVILSAGALASPHILMLSGVGDAAQLGRFGIAVKVHSPGVGRNLQDHWVAPFVARVGPDGSYNGRLRGWRKYLLGARYLATRKGFLALGSSAVSAYVRSSPEQPQPDLQLAMRPVSAIFRADGAVDIDPLPGIGGATVLVGPKSVGHLCLRSPDPLQAPAFHPNYLSDPHDIDRLVHGVKLMRHLLEAAPLADMIKADIAPGPNVRTDEQIVEFITSKGNTAWHQTGTCRMGRDQHAVVDARLNVRGVARLRVVDASIMPRITSGNTNAPTMMIGEKGADMIKEDRLPRNLGTKAPS